MNYIIWTEGVTYYVFILLQGKIRDTYSINILLQGIHVLDTRILYMYRVHEQLYFILYVHA